ncbi:shikimate kinase [Gulosibacter molinativorax]|uniref:Shikimate kinase n=1 Tax=Gulosibacter molinativorax TaxID=256821 RepID=A0ABT7C7A0_9MICO|nr:shikimate kinase [Gulosibacter molinativorax]MDJ1371059.1 shikimate kinase [Gulosibacter molinativorax]QUY61419.1 Shikimate kinase [Gulosibacter molinativorax]
MSLVFIGPPAAGKSRAGKRIARRLDATFADTDKLFARDHGAIHDFIPREGEAEFRRIEREVVANALREYEIVSLGGGAILNADTQAELASEDHNVVLLVASPKAIEERISGKTNRPLLSGIDSWVETYNSRKEIYDRLADITIDTSFRPMWQVVNDVRRFLKNIDSPLVAKASDTELTAEDTEPGELVD